MSRIKDALKKAKTEREGASLISLIDKQEKRPVSTVTPGMPQTKLINYSESAVKKYKIITPFFMNTDVIERFMLLRTKIIARMQAMDDRTVLITSSLKNEGKTFVAVNLAVTFAREVDHTVLLVDTNLKNPSITRSFGIEAEKGLTDYLLHDKPLSDLLISPGIEKLVILPPGRHVTNSAELLRSNKMQGLINEMKNRYENRYIFFDAPPMLTSVDAMILSKFIDKTLFVNESGHVKPDKVAEALNLLEEDKILGAVFNKKIYS